ncbi:MAG: dTDP-4-amino-4,6-dideoxygalactose transaminase [Myxococcota bacterium]
MDRLLNISAYVQEAIDAGQLSGNGAFTKKCHDWLKAKTGAKKALLTHSCTGALEMAALLAEVQPGDEVVMPSYTFVSTANAFVLRGATPVFVDIKEDTLNLDESLVEDAMSSKTKAICAVHYAGVSCTMEPLLDLARRKGVLVIEDAAQGAMAGYKGQPLGNIGHLGALSFHETKNIISGEGGALLVNDDALADRAEIIWEKGTNRSAFFRGEVDKYTWVDVGSSFLPGELTAAFLWAQLQEAELITRRRFEVWKQYHEAFEDLEQAEALRRPIIPEGRQHNAHMYYLLCPSLDVRSRLIARLKSSGFLAVFHYVPLHASPAGRRFGRTHGDLHRTTELSERLVRLPLWVGLSNDDVQRVIDIVRAELTR